MKKIKWEYLSFQKTHKAKVGGVVLRCTPTWSSTYARQSRSKWQWRCLVSIGDIRKLNISGPTRKTLVKSKEDAIRLAGEFLEDCRVGLEQVTNEFKETIR